MYLKLADVNVDKLYLVCSANIKILENLNCMQKVDFLQFKGKCSFFDTRVCIFNIALHGWKQNEYIQNI